MSEYLELDVEADEMEEFLLAGGMFS